MSLRLRHLLLYVTTHSGPYGVSIPFPDGLVVLRADNSSGKSTVIQSVIYALGLEGMLSASHQVPLPHVMTDVIEDDGREIPVVTSLVQLEIENSAGTRVVVSRWSKSGDVDRNLVTVYHGPALTNQTQQYATDDFYVRQPYAARNPKGFHRWFADFIGWSLPTVPRFDGTDAPLYVECIFPLMIVEQKRGWAGIQARLPHHYRIRDVAKRATEFVMALDVYKIVTQRQRLIEQVATLKADWRRVTGRCDDFAKGVNGVTQYLSREPPDSWPMEPDPEILASRDGRWVTLRELIHEDHAELARLETHEIPRVQAVASEAESALRDLYGQLGETQAAIDEMFEDVQGARGEIEALTRRLDALVEDLRQNKDIVKLKAMGSVKRLNVAGGTCPTCRQAVSDSLLPVTSQRQPMTIEENIGFIVAQVDTFRAVRQTSEKVLMSKERKLFALQELADGIRRRIRALNETLVSSGHEPSVAAIELRITLRERLRRAEQAYDDFETAMDDLEGIAGRWIEVQKELRGLPKGDLSQDDETKLDKLQAIFISQAREYGVSSLRPESLAISKDTYRPIHDGFDLEFDLSASDMIRTIWAYLYSLVELSRIEATNHLGLLILDEPRQQETARVSLAALMRRASDAGVYRNQIVFATSEEETTLRPMLTGITMSYQSFSGKMLKRLGMGKTEKRLTPEGQ